MTKRSEALSELKRARAIIDAGENRALASDGAVGHCREELSNDEFDKMWTHVERAKALLTSPSHRKPGHEFRRVGVYAGKGSVKTP